MPPDCMDGDPQSCGRFFSGRAGVRKKPVPDQHVILRTKVATSQSFDYHLLQIGHAVTTGVLSPGCRSIRCRPKGSFPRRTQM